MGSCQSPLCAWSLPAEEEHGLKGLRSGFSPSSEIHFTGGFGRVSSFSVLQAPHLLNEEFGLDDR